jgi:hypothetical protein
MTRGREIDRRMRRYADWLESGWTQRQIAEAEGISQQAVGKFIRRHFTRELKIQPKGSAEE